MGFQMAGIERKTVRSLPQKDTVVVCSRCGKISKIPLSRTQKRNFLARCTCGHIFCIMVDSRSWYRKLVMIYGKCRFNEDKREYPMVLENLSLNGLCFRSPLVKKLQVGDIVHVAFELPDRYRSLITRKGIIRHVNQQRAGMEFIQEQCYCKELAFFLQS